MPTPVDAATLIRALQANQNPYLHQAGDVVPLPIVPGPNAGPTDQSAQFLNNRLSGQNITPIGENALRQWYENMMRRRFSNEVNSNR